MRKHVLPPYPLSYSLFFFFFLFYSVMNSGHIGAYDAAMEYEVTKNMIQFGSFELNEKQFHEISAARGRDGKLYSPHGLGQSLVMIPFYLFGEGAARLFPQFPKLRMHHFIISFMNPMFTALICVMLYLLQIRLGFGIQSAISVICVYGFCTLAFPYTKVSFDVTLTAFLLLGAAYTIFRYKQTLSPKWGCVTGILVGVSLLTRIASLLVVPLFAIYLFCSFEERKPLIRIGKVLTLYGMPIILCAVFIGWYNIVRFGVFYEDGHAADTAVKLTTPVLVGLAGQLISTGKGLFVYSPILLFSLFGVSRFYRTHRREMLLFCSIICVNLFFYSKLSNWSGDWCWGPRFILPVVPFFTILIGAFLHGSGFRDRTRLKKVWICLMVLSFAVQILGVTIDGTRRIGRRYTSNSVRPTDVYWNPVESPLIDHARLLSHLSLNSSRLSHEASFGNGEIEFEDTTPDFWFVYLYLLGFPLKWIIASCSIVIVLTVYFGCSILRKTFRGSLVRC